jgi:hypothetical protein
MANVPEMEEQQIIKDARGSYFGMIPHIADDELDPYQYRAYGHYVRVCGDGGICKEATKTTATACGYGERKLRDVRQELADLGYIHLNHTITKSGDAGAVEVTLIDIWTENLLWCKRWKREGVQAVGMPPMHNGVLRYVQYRMKAEGVLHFMQEGAASGAVGHAQNAGGTASDAGKEEHSKRRTFPKKKQDSVADATARPWLYASTLDTERFKALNKIDQNTALFAAVCWHITRCVTSGEQVYAMFSANPKPFEFKILQHIKTVDAVSPAAIEATFSLYRQHNPYASALNDAALMAKYVREYIQTGTLSQAQPRQSSKPAQPPRSAPPSRPATATPAQATRSLPPGWKPPALNNGS